MDTNGQNAVNIVPNKNITAIDWSPEGARLAFAVPNDGIYVVDANGSNLVKIREAGRCVVPREGQPLESPSWSPDGQKIVFRCGDYIQIMNGNGTDVTTVNLGISGACSDSWLSCSPRRNTKWSPDGTRIAFDAPRTYTGWPPYILDMTVGGSNARLMAAGWEPAWSPDSQRIAFTFGSSVGYPPGIPSGLYVINVNAMTITQLTSGGDDSYPTWSPDGGWIAFYSNRTPNGIWVVSTDRLNGNLQFIHSGNAPAWKP